MILATSFFQDHDFIQALYLVAVITFILGLRGLAGPKTAPTGNKIAAVGMLIAIAATLLIPGVLPDGETTALIIGGIALGTAIGIPAARTVKMTAMPQMVALFNGVGGGAAALVSLAELHRILPDPGKPKVDIGIAIVFGTINIVGGFLVTDRMLAMFKGGAGGRKPRAKKDEDA